MEADHTKDWRELCKAAAQELDPVKLTEIIAELIRTLDERDMQRQGVQRNPSDNDGRQGSLRSELAVG